MKERISDKSHNFELLDVLKLNLVAEMTFPETNSSLLKINP